MSGIVKDRVRITGCNGEVEKMKKTTSIIMMILVAVIISSACAFAASKALSFALDTDPTSPYFLLSGEYYKTLDMGYVAPWLVTWTGSATISPTETTATLTGGFPVDNMWTYQWSNTGVDGTWTPFDSLISTFSANASALGEVRTTDGGPTTITTRYLRVGYNVALSGNEASASGSGSITAVPEPASLMTIGMGAVAMLFGRRKLS